MRQKQLRMTWKVKFCYHCSSNCKIFQLSYSRKIDSCHRCLLYFCSIMRSFIVSILWLQDITGCKTWILDGVSLGTDLGISDGISDGISWGYHWDRILEYRTWNDLRLWNSCQLELGVAHSLELFCLLASWPRKKELHSMSMWNCFELFDWHMFKWILVNMVTIHHHLLWSCVLNLKLTSFWSTRESKEEQVYHMR